MSEFCDHENYYIHGRNPKLPEETILKAHGEVLMQEQNYRVGGVIDFPIQVFSHLRYLSNSLNDLCCINYALLKF